MTLTRVYLRLRHTTSKIKDSSLAFCLNRSVGYAHLAVQTRKPRKNILYLLLVMKCHSVVYTMHMRLPCVYYPGHKSRTQEQSSIARRGVNLRQDNPFVQSNFVCLFSIGTTKQIRKSEQQESSQESNFATIFCF